MCKKKKKCVERTQRVREYETVDEKVEGKIQSSRVKHNNNNNNNQNTK